VTKGIVFKKEFTINGKKLIVEIDPIEDNITFRVGLFNYVWRYAVGRTVLELLSKFFDEEGEQE